MPWIMPGYDVYGVEFSVFVNTVLIGINQSLLNQ